MPLTHRQNFLITFILMLVVVGLMLALAEGTVRLRQWVKAGHSGDLSDLFVRQENLRILIPNAKTRTISINSLGFRGPPVSQEKQKNTLRIAFLGASTTFCAEVSSNELAWPHLVAVDIQNNHPEVVVDYVNAAVPGYTVRSSLQNFRRRVAPLHPDVAVIYHATNDLSWETRTLAREQGIYRDTRDWEKGWLAKHSKLWHSVVKNLHIREVQDNAMDTSGHLQFSPEELGERFRHGLTELVKEVKRVSELVVLVTFSHKIRPEQTPEQQLTAAVSARYYMPFMTPPGLLAAFNQYNRIIIDVAEETGAVLIDGDTMIPGDNIHFNDTVHFKDAGSVLMAQRVSRNMLNDTGFQRLLTTKQNGE